MPWPFSKQSASTPENPLVPEQVDAIYLQGVTAFRGERQVLQSLDLVLAERKIGLIGNNGSGKSTLARLLNGLVEPSSGQLSVYGFDAVQQAAVLPSLVGFIFQNPDHQIIFPTVLEELAFGLEQIGAGTKEAQETALQALRERGLEAWRDRPVQHLSEGQKQRLCILAVILMQPRLIVLDEPFSSLDLPTRRQMMQMLESIDAQLLMISHDMSVFTDFDRLIWLEKGQVQADGKPVDVIAEYHRHCDSEAE